MYHSPGNNSSPKKSYPVSQGVTPAPVKKSMKYPVSSGVSPAPVKKQSAPAAPKSPNAKDRSSFYKAIGMTMNAGKYGKNSLC